MKKPTARDKLIQEGIETTGKLFHNFVKQRKLRTFLSKEDLEDMHQDCLIEMIRVVDNKFDPTRGYKLSTYLAPRILGYMTDYVGEILQKREPDNELAIELFAPRLTSAISLPHDQIKAEIERLGLKDREVRDLMLDLARTSRGYEIVEALIALPEAALTVILGYYVLNQSIKELSAEHGFAPAAGWLYKIKREGIETLKQILRDKGVL